MARITTRIRYQITLSEDEWETLADALARIEERWPALETLVEDLGMVAAQLEAPEDADTRPEPDEETAPDRPGVLAGIRWRRRA